MDRQYRLRIKRRVFARRGGRCALCGDRATDLHEIVNRARTMSNAQARTLSFAEPIVAPLCNPCNLGADTNAIRKQLLEQNIILYGRIAVVEALEAVRDAMAAPYAINQVIALIEEDHDGNNFPEED